MSIDKDYPASLGWRAYDANVRRVDALEDENRILRKLNSEASDIIAKLVLRIEELEAREAAWEKEYYAARDIIANVKGALNNE
jgi:hypothetical protein